MESRLKQARKHLGFKQEDLANIFECRKENISMIERGKSSLSERNKKILVKKFNFNPLWLDGNEAPMLMPETEHAVIMQDTPALYPESIPMYDMDNLQGLAHLFRRSRRPKPSGYISIPHLPKCDGALRVMGEAMSPILRSGDLVLYRQLAGVSEIFWGEMYLISVETSAGEYIAVRYIRKSEKEGMAVLAGETPQFADTEVELSKIGALAFVKATLRLNSLK